MALHVPGDGDDIQEDPQKKVLLLYWLAITFLLIGESAILQHSNLSE